jgi:SAM-dependent methyltransferase
MTTAAQAFTRRLAATAAASYRGGFARRFARGKLTRDPLFATLLRTGAIPDAACLVDLGCGQGLLAAWLQVARASWLAGDPDWPAAWPPAPKVSTYLGIDRSRLDIRRARGAVPAFARVFEGDVRTLGATLLDRCDVVTLLDVLHYLDAASQEKLIATIAAGMPPWGVVVIRIGDVGATIGSYGSGLVDVLVATLRGSPRLRLHRRSLAAWIALLEAHAFRVEVLDDPRERGGKGFANVLLRASRAEAAASLR